MITRRDILKGWVAALASPYISRGEPRKAMLGAGDVFFLGGDSNIPTASDYVQEDLVAMWDGIENAGWGEHDDSPFNWTSLVGDGKTILLQNHFVYSFDSNSLVTTGSAGVNTFYQTVPIIADLLNTSEWTIEMMAQSYGTYNALIRTYPWGGGGDFVVERGNNVAYLKATDISGTKLFAGTGDNTTGYMASYTLRYKANVLYRDWRVVGESDARHDTIEWTKPVLKTTNYNIGRNNKYHFIRLYSRVLTAEEIAANYAIDKARFNLP